MNLFANLLFGHIVGDYFFQPQWMATKKGSGSWLAALHALICTVAICVFTKFSVLWFLFVFGTHFIIDRFSLADKWLALIDGRTLKGFFLSGHLDIHWPGENVWDADHAAHKLNYHMLRGSFAAVVYLVVDNSMHMMLYWYGYPYFF